MAFIGRKMSRFSCVISLYSSIWICRLERLVRSRPASSGAYIWALVAGALGIWAASVQNSYGIWGASRHAFTVGFLAMMVFTIGQRVLPAFSGMRLLFSTKLMFIATLFLAVGYAR